MAIDAAGGKTAGKHKYSGTVVKKNVDVVSVIVRCSEINIAIVVKVGFDEAWGIPHAVFDGSCESPSTIIQKDTDGIDAIAFERPVSGCCEVEITVTVKIGRNQVVRAKADRIANGRGKDLGNKNRVGKSQETPCNEQ